jgi:hypothetical protein
MRAVVISRHGLPDVLEVQVRPQPPLRAGAVWIAVKAAGFNFADLLARSGVYPDASPVVAAAFPFDRATAAHRLIAERRNVGKVVLAPRCTRHHLRRRGHPAALVVARARRGRFASPSRPRYGRAMRRPQARVGR